jgi:hypothetical protein
VNLFLLNFLWFELHSLWSRNVCPISSFILRLHILQLFSSDGNLATKETRHKFARKERAIDPALCYLYFYLIKVTLIKNKKERCHHCLRQRNYFHVSICQRSIFLWGWRGCILFFAPNHSFFVVKWIICILLTVMNIGHKNKIFFKIICTISF